MLQRTVVDNILQAPTTTGSAGPSSAVVPPMFQIGMQLFDYILLGCMWLLSILLFRLAHLPYAFDLAALTKSYLMLPLGAVITAIALALVGLPLQSTLLPLLTRIWNNKLLLMMLSSIALLLCWALGVGLGVVLFLEAVAFAEFSQRFADRFGQKLLDVLIPGMYLYVGLIAIFAFNHAIVGFRYGGTYDDAFNRLDWLVFHVHVQTIAQWGLRHLSPNFHQFWDFVYFGIWSRFGAALLLVAVLSTKRQAIQFVRNILICYSLALLVFAIFPAKGPYSISAVQGYPPSLGSFTTQQVLVSRMKAIYAHHLTEDVREVGLGDYYISFPSMHAALPIIALWFLRRWKWIQRFAIFNYCLLLPALVFLNWHYLVDILGGWAVAAVSIALTEWISRRIESDPVRLPSAAPASAGIETSAVLT